MAKSLRETHGSLFGDGRLCTVAAFLRGLPEAR